GASRASMSRARSWCVNSRMRSISGRGRGRSAPGRRATTRRWPGRRRVRCWRWRRRSTRGSGQQTSKINPSRFAEWRHPMRWEEQTGKTFVEAVERAQGVCILPIGVVEYHGPPLPLGTDMLHSHAVACAAAEQEPALVYPAYHFGLNTETKHFPGGIVLRDRLLFDLLENICDEISRNGLKKIILLSGHGGNRYFLPLFQQLLL